MNLSDSVSMDQAKTIFTKLPLRLRVTRSQKCAYLHDQTEQRLATDISDHPDSHDRLAETGFRRVENWVYKPACPGCSACLPIRVKAEDFAGSRNITRIRAANKDLRRFDSHGQLTLDHYDMFQRYLGFRHEDGQMASMSFEEFSAMILNSPIDTTLTEYRDSEDRLMGCILIDRQRDGLSAVYSFFQPDQTKRSLGSFMIVDLIDRCKEIGLPYAYLGYYIEQSRKMSYKARFKPYQIFIDGVWQDQ